MPINIRSVIIKSLLGSLSASLFIRDVVNCCHSVTFQKPRAVFVIPAVLPGDCVGIAWRRLCDKTPMSTVVSWRGQVYFNVQEEGGADHANSTPYCCLHILKSLNDICISLKTSRQMPQTDPDHSHLWHILVHCHQDWNHKQWSNVTFADESKVSLCQPYPLFLRNNHPLYPHPHRTPTHRWSGVNLWRLSGYFEQYPDVTLRLWTVRTLIPHTENNMSPPIRRNA